MPAAALSRADELPRYKLTDRAVVKAKSEWLYGRQELFQEGTEIVLGVDAERIIRELENPWVSVETPPEKPGRYFARFEHGDVWEGSASWSGMGWLTWHSGYSPEHLTHWMPIPPLTGEED